MKKVLMIAYAFPPFLPVGHSIRIVKFIKYLPDLGWLPVVLTIDDQQEYEATRKVGSESQLSEIQPQVKIYRSAAGELSFKQLEREKEFGHRNQFLGGIVRFFGKVRGWASGNLLLPDSKITWLPFALNKGRKIVKNEGIDIIFATCPPHSTSLIGAYLKIITGKPLILDFRDDWVDTPWYKSKPAIIRMLGRMMERFSVKTSNKVILVTESSQKAFIKRYPNQPAEKFIFIPNGCDLSEFEGLSSANTNSPNSKFIIVHAGSLNVSSVWGRNPAGLFQAVQKILLNHSELAEDLALVFAGDLPEEFRKLAENMGLSGMIEGIGNLPHSEVLQLLKTADLLLAINYDGWSSIIPGKIYEYWAIGGPPILLLSCPGAAADFVAKHKLGLTVDPSDAAGIQEAISHFYKLSVAGSSFRVSTTGIAAYDRKALAQKLSQVLFNLV